MGLVERINAVRADPRLIGRDWWWAQWHETGWDWESLKNRPLVNGLSDQRDRRFGSQFDYWTWIFNELQIESRFGLPRMIRARAPDGKVRSYSPFHLALDLQFDVENQGPPDDFEAKLCEALLEIVRLGGKPYGPRAPGQNRDSKEESGREGVLRSRHPDAAHSDGTAVYLDGVVVPGDFEFTKAGVPVSVLCYQTFFYGGETFSKARLEDDPAKKKDSALKFSGQNVFRGCYFYDDVFLDYCVAQGPLAFIDCHFWWNVSFANAEADYVFFSEVVVDGDLTLDNAKINQILKFEGVKIRASLRSEAIRAVDASIVFNDCTVAEEIKFTNATAESLSAFDVAAGEIVCSESRFSSELSWRYCEFQRLNLSGCSAPSILAIDCVCHDGAGVSAGGIVAEDFAVMNCDFHATFDCSDAKIMSARFDDTYFRKRAWFASTMFYGNASFRLAGREPSRTMRGRIVSIDAPQGQAQPGRTAAELALDSPTNHIEDGKFAQVSFSNAQFWGDVNFENRVFSARTSFYGAKFYLLPGFHNCTLHQDTDFNGTEFFPAFGPDKRSLPVLKTAATKAHARVRLAERSLHDAARNTFKLRRSEVRNGASGPFSFLKRRAAVEGNDGGLTVAQSALASRKAEKILADQDLILDRDAYAADIAARGLGNLEERAGLRTAQRAGEFERAFRSLKIMAENNRSRSDEQRFFALEIKSRVRRTQPQQVRNLEILSGWLYGLLSDYGQSLSRPLVWLLMSSGLFSLLYAAMTGDPMGSIAYTIRHLLPVFLIRDQTAADGAAAANAFLQSAASDELFLFASTVHTLWNLILWFLFALALRRRFQIN